MYRRTKADQSPFPLSNLLISLIPSLLHLVLKGFFSIPVTFSSVYAPAPTLIVYVIFPNGKIIADSAVFSVSMCFRNKVGFLSETMTKCERVSVAAATKKETEEYVICIPLYGWHYRVPCLVNCSTRTVKGVAVYRASMCWALWELLWDARQVLRELTDVIVKLLTIIIITWLGQLEKLSKD